MCECNQLFSSRCCRCYNKKIIVLSENKSKYIGSNEGEKKFCEYKIDGCVLQEATSKCDFLLVDCEEKKAYWVELKGSDLSKAIDQVDSTLDHLAADLQRCGYRQNARIVLTKTSPVPCALNNKEVKLRKKIQRLGGTLVRQNSPFRENL